MCTEQVRVSDDVEAVFNGAGRWFLKNSSTGMVSVETYPSVEEAIGTFNDGTVSWDEDSDDEDDGLASCIGCGCDDLHACWDEWNGSPCSWVRLDREARLGVCSACPGHIERWDKGDRTFAVPVEPPEDKVQEA